MNLFNAYMMEWLKRSFEISTVSGELLAIGFCCGIASVERPFLIGLAPHMDFPGV